MNDSFHKIDDLLQKRKREDKKADTYTYHNARVNWQHLICQLDKLAFLFLPSILFSEFTHLLSFIKFIRKKNFV